MLIRFTYTSARYLLTEGPLNRSAVVNVLSSLGDFSRVYLPNSKFDIVVRNLLWTDGERFKD
jgi:hypothetical protein